MCEVFSILFFIKELLYLFFSAFSVAYKPELYAFLTTALYPRSGVPAFTALLPLLHTHSYAMDRDSEAW